MLVGYARVSTQEQKLDAQIDELRNIGCEKIFTDKISGAKAERQGLEDCLNYIRSGDTLVVWKLDRLGRSVNHLLATVNELNEKGVQFRSLHESIDTNTTTGKLVFHIFAALAEFERELIKERTQAGLTAARARGKHGGRPKVMDEALIQTAQTLYDAKTQTVDEICKALGVSHATFYRYIKK